MFSGAPINNGISYHHHSSSPSPSTTAVSALPPPISSVFNNVIIKICFVICIIAICYSLIRFFFHRRSASSRNTTLPYPNHIVSENLDEDEQVSHHVITIDDNDESLDWLPVFTYSSIITENKSGVDCCAVCLTKFEAKDHLRQLPLCCHAFHVECIDPWLKSNPTCPLCRSTINPREDDIMNIIISATLNRELTINPSEADIMNIASATLNRESTINPREANNMNIAFTTLNREPMINPSEADNMNIISATLNRE